MTADPVPNLLDLASDLELSEEKLWIARARTKVSYPEEGSSRCFALEAESFWFVHRNRCITALMRRVPPEGLLWDVGGGNGFVSRALLDAGFQVALLEPFPEAARNAIQRGVPTVVCSTLEDAGFRSHCLDAAGLFDVLEHIEDDGAFLDRLHRSLRPGGRLYLTVPAHAWLWSSNDRFSGHFRRYTARRLASLLETHGFRIEHCTYFFQPLVVPIFVFRSLPSRLGLRRGSSSDKVRAEHVPSPGRGAAMLARLLEREARRIQEGRRQSVGASLLVAASTRPCASPS